MSIHNLSVGNDFYEYVNNKWLNDPLNKIPEIIHHGRIYKII